MGDFNIRYSIWDPNFLYHSAHSDLLMDITDFMNLELSKLTNQVLTRYLDNQQNLNSVINLMFLRPKSSEYDNHSIHPDWKLISDYASLIINIAIFKEHIQTRKHIIVKNSKEEENFVAELIKAIKELNIENISKVEVIEQIIQSFANDIDRI